MKDENQVGNDAKSKFVKHKSINASRRAFSKNGLIAPFIMTLANRSAWGGTNMCTQSGFASFSAQGGVVSHTAHIKNTGWKTPAGWADEPNWPANSGLGRATYDSSRQKFTSDSGLWVGEKTLAEVKEFEKSLGGVIVLRQTFNKNNNNNTVTLLAELSENNLELIDYRIATLLNNAVSPVPSYFLLDDVPEEDYQEFYANCI